MNESSPATAETGFVAAETARAQIEEATRQIPAIKGMQDLEVTIWNQSAHDWTIGVKFRCPKNRFLRWTYGPLVELGFQVTGNARHDGGDGVVATNSDGTGDKGALYTLWTVLHCEYLWVGESFADCLKSIKAIK